MEKQIKQIKKKLDYIASVYSNFFLCFLAFGGFIMGYLSLVILFMKFFESVPLQLLFIFKGFILLLYLGIFLLIVYGGVFIIEKYLYPYIKEQTKKKEKWIEKHHNLLAKEIAKEIKKGGRNGKTKSKRNRK